MGLISTLIGSAFGLFFMIFGLLSLPLSTLEVIRSTGWSWFGALIALFALTFIPIVGQLGFFILAALGGYHFWNANFDWQAAAYPKSLTYSVANLTVAELERFKDEVVRKGLEQACKAAVLKTDGFDGKLPERSSAKCECVSTAFASQLTRDDLVAYEKSGELTQEAQQRISPEIRRACPG